jgi:hypothetical protein
MFWANSKRRLDNLWNNWKENTIVDIHPNDKRIYFAKSSYSKVYSFKEFSDLFL